MQTITQLSDRATFAGFKAALKHLPRVPALCPAFTGLTAVLESADVIESLGRKWIDGFDRGRRVLQEDYSSHALFIHDQNVDVRSGYSVMYLNADYLDLVTEESNRACGDAYFVDVRAMISGL